MEIKKRKANMTTRRKMKIIGTEEYINAETGEIKEMQVISIEERDCNFHKLWLGHIIESLDMIGNQKINLCLWIMEHLDRENKLCYTYRQMSDKTGISLETVRQTMKALIESNFLTRHNSGTYIVNPDVIFKGGKTDRMNVLIQYRDAQNIENEKEINKSEDKKLHVVKKKAKSKKDVE